MKVELIPLIEVGYNNQDVETPDLITYYPFWKHAEIWDKYHAECYKLAGLKDQMKPYLPGLSFYLLENISDNNLTKLVADHIKVAQDYNERCCALFGGYVLCINGEPFFYPQCCGQLSDIKYWEELSKGNPNAYYEGHPAPKIKIEGPYITFDFGPDAADEPFVPPVEQLTLSISVNDLKIAVAGANDKLKVLAGRLNKINIEEHFNIPDIDLMLIWEL